MKQMLWRAGLIVAGMMVLNGCETKSPDEASNHPPQTMKCEAGKCAAGKCNQGK